MPAAGRRLPHGRHGLPGEVVRGHQRERLIAAMAECCADSGYAMTSVSDIVGAATVSKRTFYEFFDTKEDCLLASHEAYRERLFAAIEPRCSEGNAWPLRVRAAIRAALSFLASDLAVAQLLTTAVLCATSEGASRHYATVDAIADRIRDGAPFLSAEYPRPEWGAVVLMAAGVSRAAYGGEGEAVLALEDDFSAMILALTSEPA
jgi:AcrR family transcriptional regulator